MVEWQYLEAFVVKTPGITPVNLVITVEHAEEHGLTKEYHLFTLSELGKTGWNLVCVVDNIDKDETRMIFKRPKA
jgi:hypothetical protein